MVAFDTKAQRGGAATKDDIKRTVSPLTPAVAKAMAGRPALSPLRGEGVQLGRAMENLRGNARP